MRTDEWDRETFRKALEDIQDRTHLTEADLAALAGRSRSQVNRWTRAENQPAHAPLIRLVGGLEKFGPAVRKLGIELLAAAGYAPPEPVAQIGQASVETLPPTPGVRVEQYDDRHLGVNVTVDTESTMEEALRDLKPLTPHEAGTVEWAQNMRFAPAEIAGMLMFLRGFAEQQQQQGPQRRKA